MEYWATEFFKVAALAMGMPNVNTRGLVLPPARQKVLSNMVNVPPMPGGSLNIKPQFLNESSTSLSSPGIKQPGTGAIAKAAEFEGEAPCLALEYFKVAGMLPRPALFQSSSRLLPSWKAAPPSPVSPLGPLPTPAKPANEATTRIIRKPDAKTAEFTALAYFALLGQ